MISRGLVFVAVFALAACGQTEDRTYPAPTTFNEPVKWEKEGFFRRLIPTDSESPRFVIGTTGPEFDVFDHDAAVRDMVKDTGIKFVRPPKLEPLEAWQAYDGRDARFAFAHTRFAGKSGVAFVLISQMRGKETYGIWCLEMTRSTFTDWGGAARILVLRDVIPSVDVIPAERRPQVANAPLDQQMTFYEMAVNAQYKAVASAVMGMIAQGQTLEMMRNLNFDLAFGRELDPSPLGPD